MQDMNEQGILFIVGTPIGNLEDITLRALRILKEADVVAAEDTRHTRKLFSKYDIHTTLTSYHDYNKEEKSKTLVKLLLEGKNIALVTDAGTPAISDPGYFLINMAINNGIKIEPIPGPSAVISALSISGLPTDRFLFLGFLPQKSGKRTKILEEVKNESATLIFYESPYRLLKRLPELLEIFGDRKIVIARELTKMYEEIIRLNISDAIRQLEGKKVKGEITLLVEGVK